MFRRLGSAILGAFASLFSRRILWLMVWPVLAASFLWGIVVIVFWSQLVVSLSGLLNRWITTATFFVNWDATTVALVSAKIIVVLMLVPLVQLTALMILGVFGMDAMVDAVASRRFPALARRKGGSFAGSLLNSAVALAGMVVLFLLSLPLWVFPPLWPVIPVLVMGWVNQRMLRYDALSAHATADEMKKIFSQRKMALYALGLVLALIAYVPIIGFFAPVLLGLAFIHFLLAELEAMRTAPIEGEVVSRQLEG
jgi:hypothetical protein